MIRKAASKYAKPRPAIFQDMDVTYRADTCEPLKAATRNGTLTLTGFGRNCYPGTELPPAVMPELSLSCVWDATRDQDWGLPAHRNEGVELGFLSGGRLDFQVENHKYSLTSGDLTLTRPWQPHKVGLPNITASRMHWLIIDVGVRRPSDTWKWPQWMVFSKDDLEHLTDLLRYNEQPVWKADKKIDACFEKLAEITAAKKPENVQTRLRLCINELFLELYELLRKKDIKLDPNLAATSRSVEMFLIALPEHLDYPWTLEDMAEHCNLGRSRFTHHCKLLTNMTPVGYLNHCRVKKARKLLNENPRTSVTEIAFTCGFDSSQYFCRVFKQKTGKTPTDFRETAFSKS